MNNIENIIKSVISAVETLAPKTWELLVREQVINGWVTILQSCFWLVVLNIAIFAGYKFFTHYINKWKKYLDKEYSMTLQDNLGLFIIFRWILLVLIPIIQIIIITTNIENIARIKNPEVFAARELINNVTETKKQN